jgi:hypothetical protein
MFKIHFHTILYPHSCDSLVTTTKLKAKYKLQARVILFTFLQKYYCNTNCTFSQSLICIISKLYMKWHYVIPMSEVCANYMLLLMVRNKKKKNMELGLSPSAKSPPYFIKSAHLVQNLMGSLLHSQCSYLINFLYFLKNVK